jgi:hypothetical protein
MQWPFRLSRVMPGVAGSGGPRPAVRDQFCCVLRARSGSAPHDSLCNDAEAGESSAPSPSQRMRKGREYMYVVSVTLDRFRAFMSS